MLHVAVGVIKNSDGKVLLARRPQHVHQGGLWEFPGGKVEQGETVELALARELEEELSIVISDQIEPLIQVRHHYSDKSVLLDVWLVSDFSGEPYGREGQPLEWVYPEELKGENQFPLPAANAAIIKSLNLPDRMMITGETHNVGELSRRLTAGLRRGIKLVQFRMPTLPFDQQKLFFESSKKICTQSKAKLIVNVRNEEVLDWEADGFHISAELLQRLSCRPVANEKILGASCHNLKELQQAQQIDVDYVTLSPVHHTSSHPDADALGWTKFSELVAEVNIPVFALGGMRDEDLPRAKSVGAQGIAAISEFWE